MNSTIKNILIRLPILRGLYIRFNYLYDKTYYLEEKCLKIDSNSSEIIEGNNRITDIRGYVADEIRKENDYLKVLENRIKALERRLNDNQWIIDHGINKEKINCQMLIDREWHINTEFRTKKIIISLTSFPDRIYDIHYAIYSLLCQTLKADAVILFLGIEQFPEREDSLPESLLKLRRNGLEIRFCHDVKSYKKLVYALKEYPNDIIVTADDDLFYKADWLEKLYIAYLEKPHVIWAHRAHKVLIEDGQILPYERWQKNIITDIPSSFIFPTTGGGVLFPPNCFHKHVCDEEKFMELCPKADDIWFWAMLLMKNKVVGVVRNPYTQITYVNPERERGLTGEYTLFSDNKNQNSNQLTKLMDEYPKIRVVLTNKKRIKQPLLTVVIPLYNKDKYLKECLDSVYNQTFQDYEVIIVNDGSTDNSMEIVMEYEKRDHRIIVVEQENSGAGIARNVGIERAKGKYIYFLDADDYIDQKLFEKAVTIIEQKSVDIVSFDYNVLELNPRRFIKKNSVRSYLLGKDYDGKNITKYVNDRRILDIIDPIPWNKMYRLDFIKDNNIRFAGTMTTNDVTFTSLSYIYAKGIWHISSCLVCYRVGIDDCISAKKCKNVKDLFMALKLIYTKMNEDDIFIKYRTSFYFCSLNKIRFYRNMYITEDKAIGAFYYELKSFYDDTCMNDLCIYDIDDNELYDYYLSTKSFL